MVYVYKYALSTVVVTLVFSHTQVQPDQAGFVTHICFAETHVTGGGPQASLWVSTKGSSVIRYSLTIPEPAERLSQINRALVAGTCIRCSLISVQHMQGDYR